jgi:type I restriction enzyme M protein
MLSSARLSSVAAAIWLARSGSTKDEIRVKMQEYYNLDFTLNAIRPFYKFDATCMGTVPPAIVAFLEATGFESAIRNAISIGGDSDTLAACTGAIAEAFFGVPEWTRERLEERWLRGDLREIIYEFEKVYPPKLA